MVTDCETYQDVSAAAEKERSLAKDVADHPKNDIQTSPIQTTSNTYEKSEVATSPGTAGPTEHHASATDAAIAKAKEHNPVEKAKEHTGAAAEKSTTIPTTTNTTQEKVAPATSPATAVADKSTTSDKATPATTVAADKSTISDEKDKSHTRDTTTATSSSTPSSSPSKAHGRKPSMKDKIVGEMKIMTGKLSRNAEKVEEGRALKSGVSPTSAGIPK